MRKLALQIEHKYKNRIVGVHVVEGKGALTTLGSSQTADIRILGEDVAGFHAAFERIGEGWVLSDLGSESGTWVDKKPVIEFSISNVTVINIGGHQLKATPHSFERPLFNSQTLESKGEFSYHQVIILKDGLLSHSELIEANQSYTPAVPGGRTLSAPKDVSWVVTEIGNYTIKQRLVKSDRFNDSVASSLDEDWRKKAPFVAAMLLIFLVIGAMFLAPHRPDNDLKTLSPQMQNQFTRMIYDGKKMRTKKAEAEKLRKSMTGQSQTGVAKTAPGGDTGAKTTANTKAPTSARVVVNLKNAGLGALIGKVAARAAKNAQLVQAAGVSADSHASGRALGVGGGSSLDKLGGGKGNPNTQSMKVGGLGTAGKGGGSTGYKGTGALSLGNIGNAEVGAIEEESEVEGGLDKEAIARVIRSQLGQIRYCYERQLSANPDLYGKILVKFTIGAAGSVVTQAIGTTSLKNAMVEGCILRRVAGWQFPTPKGGTNVLVSYPFLFKSTR
jgi:hypothetical protein